MVKMRRKTKGRLIITAIIVTLLISFICFTVYHRDTVALLVLITMFGGMGFFFVSVIWYLSCPLWDWLCEMKEKHYGS